MLEGLLNLVDHLTFTECVVFVVVVVAENEGLLEHHPFEYHPSLHNHFLSFDVSTIDICTTFSHSI